MYGMKVNGVAIRGMYPTQKDAEGWAIQWSRTNPTETYSVVQKDQVFSEFRAGEKLLATSNKV